VQSQHFSPLKRCQSAAQGVFVSLSPRITKQQKHAIKPLHAAAFKKLVGAPRFSESKGQKDIHNA